MRKNSIRKLVHGILDLLPLFVIPIFAININQKSVEPISIEVQEKISVDFNQLCKPRQSAMQDFNINGVDYTYQSTGVWDLNGTQTINSNTDLNQEISFKNGHEYYVRTGSQHCCLTQSQTWTTSSGNYTFVANGDRTMNISMFNYANTVYNHDQCIPQVHDLTQMGISRNDFDVMFPNSYYAYTESQKMLVDKTSITTYDDTDIGSQFLYSLYISTDNYFNMNQVFNLNSVYQWFELNIFGGSAPLSIYIVWNIIIYELVMDLLMLLYALFMFFIDMCQRLIDKPLESIK